MKVEAVGKLDGAVRIVWLDTQCNWNRCLLHQRNAVYCVS